jgi:signal transduction histidine kinase
MLKRIRRLRISLAAKCQILFGAAVVLIISAALYVPWYRMEQLIQEVNQKAGEVVARQAEREHAAREFGGDVSPMTMPSDETLGEVPGYMPATLISANPPKDAPLSRFQRMALEHFMAGDTTTTHYDETVSYRGVERYRMAMPLYVTDEPSCIRCHADAASTEPFGAMAGASMPASGPLLGMVVVDIPSEVNANELFLNRAWILIAGLFAGTLAILVFYVITTRIILQPVRVLQETAEKVSEGDLNIRSDISTGDEFQQLSETFNTMLVNLRASDEQLRSSNKALDLKLGQLAETNVALYESNRLKSEFLANVSHELRTPLNSILGFAELLRDQITEKIDAKTLRYVQNILASGRNLLDLINDLLDLAKIEAGRMDVRSEPLSLGDVFEGLINLLRPLGEQKNLTIESQVSPDVPIIQTDPAKLQQVLYNFLSNAIKFSPIGGKVELIAKLEGPEQIRIAVTDQGSGIEPEKHDVIFEKFRQIDGSVTREHGGSGLGLAISKELISLLGGAIGVQSDVGQGATFWIILPLKTQPGQRDVRSKMAMTG